MSGGFRRAELRGSDELFQPSRPADDRQAVTPALRTRPPGGTTAGARPEAPPARHEGRLVRLTDEEIDILADAVQRLKYPTNRPPTKPPMDVFERLEELRKKLIDAR